MLRYVSPAIALWAAAFVCVTNASSQDLNPALAPIATERFLDEAMDAGIEPVWTDTNYAALIDAIRGLSAHGLTPAHYHLAALQDLTADPEARDRLATDAWMSAAAHMLYGKLDPISYEPNWTAGRREANLGDTLMTALDNGTVRDSLDALAPAQRHYGAMQQELARWTEAADRPTTFVPSGPSLKPGMTDARIGLLQTRLVELGFLADGFLFETFDQPTEDAVITFQVAEGLDPDGVVGPATLALLNLGAGQKVSAIRVNMERWRWLPDQLGPRHVRVNIAAFSVTTYENGASVRTHQAIVGRQYRKTPVFSDQIEYIVFNPWWETPPSLAKADKLPMFQADPGAVKRLGFEVRAADGALVDPDTLNWMDYSRAYFPFRLRQAPGPDNALGHVKIMFPNVHNVYIHDTPGRDLFARRQRAFSSGCIRTQDPLDLSAWLLSEAPNWSPEAIASAVQSGRETRATLPTPIPVHVLYLTAAPDGTGGVRYLDDIYDRDQRVLSGLDELPL